VACKCQQSAEKYLKAVLQEASIGFGKTHDLETLLQLAIPRHSSLNTLRSDCQRLNDYAVRYRYPGMDATVRQARQAVQAARRVRKAVLAILK
jgi:HEPN domain-containing protein